MSKPVIDKEVLYDPHPSRVGKVREDPKVYETEDPLILLGNIEVIVRITKREL